MPSPGDPHEARFKPACSASTASQGQTPENMGIETTAKTKALTGCTVLCFWYLHTHAKYVDFLMKHAQNIVSRKCSHCLYYHYLKLYLRASF